MLHIGSVLRSQNQDALSSHSPEVTNPAAMPASPLPHLALCTCPHSPLKVQTRLKNSLMTERGKDVHFLSIPGKVRPDSEAAPGMRRAPCRVLTGGQESRSAWASHMEAPLSRVTQGAEWQELAVGMWAGEGGFVLALRSKAGQTSGPEAGGAAVAFH